MKQKDKELYTSIDNILWTHWDPIGINADEYGRDEYSNYVPKILQYLKEGTDKKKLADYLHQNSTVNMGTNADFDRDNKVAKMLIQEKERILG